ncbi:MAG: TonB-dependent receptor plug domain-containing protein [Bacteroidetes bacterium]|nr:TonB-dependent receptor plug domain-containing protein [Bacteroidota bacterium]
MSISNLKKPLSHTINHWFIFLLLFVLKTNYAFSQGVVSGTVFGPNNQPLAGAGVVIKGTSQGTGTDAAGKFTLSVPGFPVTLEVTYLGYENQEVVVTGPTNTLKVLMQEGSSDFGVVEVKADRISEKQREEPLTVESIGLKAIQEAPAASFYESLGNLKGVDVTAASLGFRVVNTRGFNSTSPVRSLQLIDGVDNQSPGLNFALGNFLGANDLDIRKVDIIAGASSSFYGPNAFNGVISMETKNPFDYPGVMVETKLGERNLAQAAFRYAQVFKNKSGRDVFAYKLGLFYMTALDWKAENYSPTSDALYGPNNPGGYDAVNVYGDESLSANNNYTSPTDKYENPGLGYFYRTGYREVDLVNYKTENLKFNTSLNYRFNDSLELIYAFNLGGGSTVYQGDNRYRLQDIWFWQQRLELRQKDKYFIRFYTTQEDAGNTYDIVSTAFRLNEISKSNGSWNTAYKTDWKLLGFKKKVENLPGYPTYNPNVHESIENWANNYLDPFLLLYHDSLVRWHNQNRAYVDQAGGGGTFPRYNESGAGFDSIFSDVTSRLFTDGGTRFYDRSALYHLHGEYKFKPKYGEITVGGNGRMYRPDSKGTILEDTGSVVITNHEFGVYTGLDKSLNHDKMKMNVTMRMDKNQNFNFLFSPAASLVYKYDKKNTFRFSFSSAIRNPTLSDQYLYYNVGRARLVGNLNGFDSLITIESFNNYRASVLDLSKLVYFNVDPIRPEKAKTVELGYKGSLLKNSLFIDAGAYMTLYRDFIGYNIGLVSQFDQATGFPLGGIQVYRVAANAKKAVTTQGAAVSISYYYKKYALTGNYSWNRLNKKGTEDPIIPAFNTPEHKFNIGWSGRNMSLFHIKTGEFGFGINYKWIAGFTFEGSPQFTGSVPSYDMVDVQINYHLIGWHCTFKLGASNVMGILPLFDKPEDGMKRTVFNNLNYQVYGGPYVGRLAYFSVLFDLNPK